MANLEPQPIFDDVYELKQTDKVDALGVSNLQAQQLANRTEYLNKMLELLGDEVADKEANDLQRELATATAGAVIAHEDEQTISVDSETQLSFSVVQQSNDLDILEAGTNRLEVNKDSTIAIACNLSTIKQYTEEHLELTLTLFDTATIPATPIATKTLELYPSDENIEAHEFNIIATVSGGMALELYADLQVVDEVEEPLTEAIDIVNFSATVLMGAVKIDYATQNKEGIIKIATIAEAQAGTNAVKAITPVTLANTSNLFVKPKSRRGRTLFIKTAPAEITIPKGFRVAIDGFSTSLENDVVISLNTDLDTGTKEAGRDYLVYMQQDGSFYFKLDDGLSTSPDLLIGGLHYGLTTEDEATSGNKTEADMVLLRGINAYSIWDLNFRAIGKAGNRGMFYYPSRGKWYDIYLADEDYGLDFYSKPNAFIAAGGTENGRKYPKIPLIFGGNGTANYGKFTPFVAMDLANASGKQSIGYEEFTGIAYGVQEGLSQAEPVAGKTGHQPALTSKYGMEQATGVQWIWGADFGSSSSGSWNNHTDGRGQVYSGVVVLLLGGHRRYAAGQAGSRCSHWHHGLSISHWDIGWRGRSDHLNLDRMSESE